MTSALVDSLLKGLGCNMLCASPELFPEECLVQLSSVLIQDAKALALATAAVLNNSKLIHPELLLKVLTQSDSADLNVIAALLSKTEDRRFEKIINYCKLQKKVSKSPAKILTLAVKIGQSAIDTEFEKFGIKISQVNSVDSKKISKIESLIKSNIFFKNRLIFGCNWRADVISCVGMGLENPTEIRNRLHCSYETAHRVFTDYMTISKVNIDKNW